MKVPYEVKDYYTDIMAHCYEPGGFRLAIGTSTGKVVALIRTTETDEVHLEMETSLPFNKAVMSLHWGQPGIFVGSKSLLYLYKTNVTERTIDTEPAVKFDCNFDCHDVCAVKSQPGKVFVACEDCRIRAWDIETEKIVAEYKDHGSIVEVARANDDHVASGGQDGKVHVYDGHLRTSKPIMSFTHGKKTIGGLAISNTSTWLAAGSFGGPVVYSLKNGVQFTQIQVENPKKIYASTFDDTGCLWWGGGNGTIYKSEDLSKVNHEMKTLYGRGKINHVYSITATLQKRLSVAGSTNGMLISDNSVFWDSMVYV